jgi:protein-S-isoprenylcysteine O-methyltransferase Ste14
MYSAILIMWPGIALELGSWWALVPAAVIVIVFVIRTALEDRNASGPNYNATRSAAYRLVPGLW